MNIIGALNLNDIARTVTREYQQINSETVCQFFIATRQTYPVSQKVHLILDGAPYLRTWLVQDWAFVMNIGAAITGFFDRTLPAIAEELRHRINDNFQMLNPASSG